MAQSSENFKKIMSNPKQRNIYLATAGIGLVTIIIGLFVAGKNEIKTPSAGTSVAPPPPNLKVLPGTSNSQSYNEKSDEFNKVSADNALKEDKTYMPPPVNNKVDTASPLDDLDKQKQQKAKEEEIKEKAPEPAKEPEKIVEPEPTKVEVQPVQPVVQAPVKPQKKWGSDDDYMLIASLQNAWKPREATSEFNYYGTTLQNQNGTSGTNSQGGQSSSTYDSSVDNGILLGKAGTIYHAVLETGINSDEPSPVLAKIVSGKFKGARLIGNMVTSGSKVVVEFNTISLPDQPTSLKIKAVAVDPGTARTGLASDVNNHYFLKYGILLASTFLGGYADAVAQQNTNQTVSNGTVVVTKGNFNNQQLAMQGFGSVGKELANETRQQTQNLKPTITVDSGIAIGVLLMEDFYQTKN